jgi:hypothetical protein
MLSQKWMTDSNMSSIFRYVDKRAIYRYIDSDMSKSTNTVVYFDWKTGNYIYACGKCMLPNGEISHIQT